MQYIVSEFPLIRSIDVSDCGLIKPDGIDAIATGLPLLTSFSGSDFLSNTFSSSLVNLVESHQPKLEKLEIPGVRWASPSLIQAISSLTSISTLDITAMGIPATASCMKLFRSISPHLKVLRISSCTFTLKKVLSACCSHVFPQL